MVTMTTAMAEQMIAMNDRITEQENAMIQLRRQLRAAVDNALANGKVVGDILDGISKRPRHVAVSLMVLLSLTLITTVYGSVCAIA